MKMTYRLFYIFYLSLKSKKQKICLGDYNFKKKSAERVVLRVTTWCYGARIYAN